MHVESELFLEPLFASNTLYSKSDHVIAINIGFWKQNKIALVNTIYYIIVCNCKIFHSGLLV